MPDAEPFRHITHYDITLSHAIIIDTLRATLLPYADAAMLVDATLRHFAALFHYALPG